VKFFGKSLHEFEMGPEGISCHYELQENEYSFLLEKGATFYTLNSCQKASRLRGSVIAHVSEYSCVLPRTAESLLGSHKLSRVEVACTALCSLAVARGGGRLRVQRGSGSEHGVCGCTCVAQRVQHIREELTPTYARKSCSVRIMLVASSPATRT